MVPAPDTIGPMTVPDRRTAARLLRSLEPGDWFLRHACVVADVAAWLARSAVARGVPVDARLTETAALLHDIDKLPAVHVDGLRHGDGSAAWLMDHGLEELAPVVRDHPVTRLAEDAFARWVTAAPLEARIVAYADKRGGQRLESMDERFASWRLRYPPGSGVRVKRTGKAAWSEDTMQLVEQRARDLELGVCHAAGVRPEHVRRLRWSRRVLRESKP
jgi:predicted hydrolase (HD superfamily)